MSFEQYAKEYDAWFEKNNELYRDQLQTLQKILKNHDNGFEIGSGTGRFCISQIKKAIEPSMSMRTIALQRGCPVVNADASDLSSFYNKEYDFVLFMTTICFVNDPLKALRESYKIIKNGGFVLLGFIDGDSNPGKEYKAKKQKSKFYKDAHFFSRQTLQSLTAKAGFTQSKLYPCSLSNNPIVFLQAFVRKI